MRPNWNGKFPNILYNVFPDSLKVQDSFTEGLKRKSGKFQKAWNILRWTGIFPDCLSSDSLQVAWTIYRWPEKFPDGLTSFQMAWKFCRLPGKFPDGLESFQKRTSVFKDFPGLLPCVLVFFPPLPSLSAKLLQEKLYLFPFLKNSVMRFLPHRGCLVLLAGCLVTSTTASLPSLSLAHHSPEEFARLHRPLLRFDGSAETFCYPDMVIREQFLWLTTLLRQQTRTTTSANRSTPPPRSTTASLSVAMVTLSWSWLGRQAAFITLYNLKSWSKALLVWQAEGLRSLWSGPGASPKNLKGVQPTKFLSQIRSANWEICRVTNLEIHRDTNLEICRVTVTTGNTSLSTLWGMARGNMYRTASPGCYPSSSSIFIFSQVSLTRFPC